MTPQLGLPGFEAGEGVLLRSPSGRPRGQAEGHTKSPTKPEKVGGKHQKHGRFLGERRKRRRRKKRKQKETHCVFFWGGPCSSDQGTLSSWCGLDLDLNPGFLQRVNEKTLLTTQPPNHQSPPFQGGGNQETKVCEPGLVLSF